MENQEVIMVFSAHPDDEIFGAGGTMAKYASEGKHIISIVFSHGENSHIWLKRKVIAKLRVLELRRAEAIIGCQELIFFGFPEGKFSEQFSKRRIREKIQKLILMNRPIKIFTHSSDDPLPDHRETYRFVARIAGIMRMLGKPIEVYSFDVWNPWNLNKRKCAKLVVDISKTFSLKTRALSVFESQKNLLGIIPLIWSVYIKAFFYGLDYDCKFAEVFYRII